MASHSYIVEILGSKGMFQSYSSYYVVIFVLRYEHFQATATAGHMLHV